MLLIAHAAFKAALFLTVGVIDHQTHTRDLRALTGLGRRWPVVAAGAALAAASMAGIPPLLGFIAKELALDGLARRRRPDADPCCVTLVVVGSMFTVAYSARFVWGAFGAADTHHGLERTLESGPTRRTRPRPSPPRRWCSPAAGLLFGVVPALIAPLVDDAWETSGSRSTPPTSRSGTASPCRSGCRRW